MHAAPASPHRAAAPDAWGAAQRLLLPLLFTHAAAVLLSWGLAWLPGPQASVPALFALLASVTLPAALAYHTLQVRAAGKCVLVSGCEAGLGSAVAHHLDRLGFTVFAGFAEEGPASKSLKERSSGRLSVLPLDVTSDASVHAALHYVLSRLPSHSTGLWGLVHGAAEPAYGEVEWVPLHKFGRAVQVNLLGPVRLTQAFLPLLRSSKGRVVSVSSAHGRVAAGMEAALCVTRAALESFSECLRLEMRRWGVDVVVVEPGRLISGSWLNRKEMLEEARDMWCGLSPEARCDYGQRYFEQRIRSLDRSSASDVERDVGSVVRCCGDAVVRTFPLPRYSLLTPRERLEAMVASHLPASVYRTIYS